MLDTDFSKAGRPLLALFACLAGVLAVCSASLLNPQIGGLDQAHNLMDGVFFRDFFHDLPFSRLKSYPIDYYKQYPALGFIFWPPFFPFVEGVFFSVSGVSLLTAQISVLFFGTILALTSFYVLKRDAPYVVALIGTFLILTLPGLYPYFNSIMREIPTLAMMALALLCYFRATQDSVQTFWRWQALAIVTATALYTKQTAFVLVIAIAIDTLITQRKLLNKPYPWLAVLTFVILTAPLIAFTFVFGKANLAQSVGSNTQLIMSDYAGPGRWSLASWLFYPRSLVAFLNPLLLATFLLALVISFTSKDSLRKNALYLIWIAAFYLIFSFFDNKSERFLSLIAIPIAILTTTTLWDKAKPYLNKGGLIAPVILLVCIGVSIKALLAIKIHSIKGAAEIVERFDITEVDGNFAYFGSYRQIFVYLIRVQDQQRSHYILQGDDLFQNPADVLSTLNDYRVRYIFAEPDNLLEQEAAAVNSLSELPQISLVHSGNFYRSDQEIQLIILRNEGQLPETMKSISLSSGLIN